MTEDNNVVPFVPRPEPAKPPAILDLIFDTETASKQAGMNPRYLVIGGKAWAQLLGEIQGQQPLMKGLVLAQLGNLKVVVVTGIEGFTMGYEPGKAVAKDGA